jgi:hypothetical protein
MSGSVTDALAGSHPSYADHKTMGDHVYRVIQLVGSSEHRRRRCNTTRRGTGS